MPKPFTRSSAAVPTVAAALLGVFAVTFAIGSGVRWMAQVGNPQVTLQGVIVGDTQVTVTYAKNFADCVWLSQATSNQALHTANLFCGDGGPVTIPLPEFNGLAAGMQVKMCNGSFNLCSGVVTAQPSPDAVSLRSVTMAGGQVTVAYEKNFTACAWLKNAATDATLHTHNIFCGNGGTVTVPGSEFSGLTVGQQVKLCHADRPALCGGPVTVAGAQGGSSSSSAGGGGPIDLSIPLIEGPNRIYVGVPQMFVFHVRNTGGTDAAGAMVRVPLIYSDATTPMYRMGPNSDPKCVQSPYNYIDCTNLTVPANGEYLLRFEMIAQPPCVATGLRVQAYVASDVDHSNDFSQQHSLVSDCTGVSSLSSRSSSRSSSSASWEYWNSSRSSSRSSSSSSRAMAAINGQPTTVNRATADVGQQHNVPLSCQWNSFSTFIGSTNERYVVFASRDDAPPSWNTELLDQVYLYDRVTNTTQALTNAAGLGGQPRSGEKPSISPDGRFIAFSGLLTADSGAQQLVLFNRETGAYVPGSLASNLQYPPSVNNAGVVAFKSGYCAALYDSASNTTKVIAGYYDTAAPCLTNLINPVNAPNQPLALGGVFLRETYFTQDGGTLRFTTGSLGQSLSTFYSYDLASGAAPVRLGTPDLATLVSADAQTMYYMRMTSAEGRRSLYSDTFSFQGPIYPINPGHGGINDGGLYIFGTSIGGGRLAYLGGGSQQRLGVFDRASNTLYNYGNPAWGQGWLTPQGNYFVVPDRGNTSYSFRGSTYERFVIFAHNVSTGDRVLIPRPGGSCQ